VAFLREEFQRSHPALEVFVDKYSLKMGGSAMPAIEAALGDAFVGAAPMHGHCVHQQQPRMESDPLAPWQYLVAALRAWLCGPMLTSPTAFDGFRELSESPRCDLVRSMLCRHMEGNVCNVPRTI
jgi:hypothetical protein